MQIVTRLPGDSLHIGDTVVVKVLGYLLDGSVRIGIEAPKDTEIHWGEVYARITKRGEEAAPQSRGDRWRRWHKRTHRPKRINLCLTTTTNSCITPVTGAERFCNALLSELSHVTGRVNLRDESLLVDAYYQSIHHRPSSLVGLVQQMGSDTRN